MTSGTSPGHPRVADERQAALLLDPPVLNVVHALMRMPRSAGELAAHLNLPLRRVCTLVGKLEQAGIAEVVERRARRGRAVKVYAVPPLWRVPFRHSREVSLEDWQWTGSAGYFRRVSDLVVAGLLARESEWDFWVSPGRVYLGNAAGVDVLGGPDPVHAMIGGLMLTDEDARELKRRLLELLHEFERRSRERPGPRSYALSLMLAPGQWWGDEAPEDLTDPVP